MSLSKVTPLSGLDTTSKNFAIRVTLGGVSVGLQYLDAKSGEVKEYAAAAGVEAGSRVSLAFFGEALAKYKLELRDGRTVTLQGAMIGIRHARSVSTVPYDLKLDRFAMLSDWDDTVIPVMPPLAQCTH